MRGAPFAKEAYQIISELNSKRPYALCLKGGWSVRQRYINLVYFLIVFLLALSFVSIYVFPDLFLIFYVLAVNIVPISAVHFCSGFILKSIDMDSDYNSWFMNAALIHPGFLKIIYFGEPLAYSISQCYKLFRLLQGGRQGMPVRAFI